MKVEERLIVELRTEDLYDEYKEGVDINKINLSMFNINIDVKHKAWFICYDDKYEDEYRYKVLKNKGEEVQTIRSYKNQTI